MDAVFANFSVFIRTAALQLYYFIMSVVSTDIMSLI